MAFPSVAVAGGGPCPHALSRYAFVGRSLLWPLKYSLLVLFKV